MKTVSPIAHTWMLILLLPSAAPAQDAASDFQQNCAACHSIGGGPLMGPDLRDISQRRDRAWLVRFIVNPQAVVDSGDPYAKKLVADSGGIVMPAVDGLGKPRAEALLTWLDKQTGVAAATSDAPKEPTFTPEDITRGEALFTGRLSLEKSGPPCNSCHHLHLLPAPGGGRLGPDLSGEVKRLGGTRSLTAWLGATPTHTMKAIYATKPLQPSEINALTAYLATASGAPTPPARGQFTLWGLAGGALALLLLDRIWKNRFTAVRRPLAEGNGVKK